MKQHNNSNKGFSLLELLVAAAILAIVVIPLLSAFLTSTTVSAKAKNKERATTAATNVMENMKADGVESILSGGEVVDNGDGTLLYTSLQTVDGKEYTVEAVLDATSDPTDATDETTDYNQQKLAEIYSMSATYDAFYQQAKEQDREIAEELRNKLGQGNADNIFKKMQRDMNVSISKTGITTTVYVQCNYYYVSGSKRVDASSPKQCIYSSSQAGVDLRNIYLFYQPMYTSNNRNNDIKENMTIENNSLLPVNVYLIRQNEDEKEEDKYGINVICLEKGRANSDYIKNNTLVPLTNLRSNLAEEQMKIYYGTVNGSYSNTKTINGTSYSANEILHLTGLEGAITQERVFRVTINAYEGKGDNKGDESLITLTTTMQKE